LGNQGTEDIGRVKEGNGFSMGPFGERVNAARDLLEGDSNIYDRFGGDFFDSDELEIYLYQRGVAIPAGADYVAVEVDEGAFGAEKVGSGVPLGSSSSATEASSPSMPSGMEEGTVGTVASYAQQTGLWTAGGENLFSTFADFGGRSTSRKRRLTVDVNRLIDGKLTRCSSRGEIANNSRTGQQINVSWPVTGPEERRNRCGILESCKAGHLRYMLFRCIVSMAFGSRLSHWRLYWVARPGSNLVRTIKNPWRVQP
jgi:hypothetical protein